MHERLEKELNFLDPDLTESCYRDLLARFYGFYAPWEESLQPWIRSLQFNGADLHARAPELARDLRFFSLDPANVPTCSAVPPVGSAAEAAGNLYVREGASLGGQIISRHLESVLGLSETNGYRFFSGAGHNVGQRWKQFQATLLDHSSPENDERIIVAARAAFESIRCWVCAK